ncbi:hypothetical protein EVAR_55943_1 [Eumeta japonica]|uniref:Uncharacterized protein n=1 Tax=Eumeta variegata TaxID=151549 RepID=A0A4C1YVQ9_EUMVA|nr:hypothetical protein EVAR_55943_1 [Eumeta japonica]
MVARPPLSTTKTSMLCAVRSKQTRMPYHEIWAFLGIGRVKYIKFYTNFGYEKEYFDIITEGLSKRHRMHPRGLTCGLKSDCWNQHSKYRGAAGTCQKQTEKIIVLPGLAILAPPRVYALCLGTGGTALFTALAVVTRSLMGPTLVYASTKLKKKNR